MDHLPYTQTYEPPVPLSPDLQEAITVRVALFQALGARQSVRWSSTLEHWWNVRMIPLLSM